MLNFKSRWLVLVFVAILMFGALTGCGGTSSDSSDSDTNGDPDGSDDPGGDVEQGEEINFEAFWDLDWKGSESLKFDWWQKVDGEESSGWLTVDLSEGDDGDYILEYHGVLGDNEYSNTETLVIEQGGISIPLGSAVRAAVNHYYWPRLWDEASMPVLEYFDGADVYRVGEKVNMLDHEIEYVGYDTYAGLEGLTITIKEQGNLWYEVCLSPDVAINLYSYTYDTYSGNEYRIELVEYTD